MSRRNHHHPNHRLPFEAAAGPPRVAQGVNCQLYTQQVPGVGAMQVLQLADETGTLMVRFGLPGHIRTALAAELAKPLSSIVLPEGTAGGFDNGDVVALDDHRPDDDQDDDAG